MVNHRRNGKTFALWLFTWHHRCYRYKYTTLLCLALTVTEALLTFYKYREGCIYNTQAPYLNFYQRKKKTFSDSIVYLGIIWRLTTVFEFVFVLFKTFLTSVPIALYNGGWCKVGDRRQRAVGDTCGNAYILLQCI